MCVDSARAPWRHLRADRTAPRRACHHRRVAAGDDGPLRMRPVRFAGSCQKGARLPHAVDDVLRVEDLVPAVFELTCPNIISSTSVGRAQAPGNWRRDSRSRREPMRGPASCLRARAPHVLPRNSGIVVNGWGGKCANNCAASATSGRTASIMRSCSSGSSAFAILRPEWRTIYRHNAVQDAAFNAPDGIEAAVVRDVGGLRRPRRACPDAGRRAVTWPRRRWS